MYGRYNCLNATKYNKRMQTFSEFLLAFERADLALLATDCKLAFLVEGLEPALACDLTDTSLTWDLTDTPLPADLPEAADLTDLKNITDIETAAIDILLGVMFSYIH